MVLLNPPVLFENFIFSIQLSELQIGSVTCCHVICLVKVKASLISQNNRKRSIFSLMKNEKNSVLKRRTSRKKVSREKTLCDWRQRTLKHAPPSNS